MLLKMFSGVKNNMLAKLSVEKFLSVEYVKLINELLDLLRDPEFTKDQVYIRLDYLKWQIIKKYNLSDKDFENVDKK